MSERDEELLLKKRALLFQRLQARREGEQRAPDPIARQPRDAAAFPLSFAQQRLWFLDQLQPGAALYNIHTAVRMAGPLDLAALRRSLDAIVARHEILRTTFRAHAGQPVQVIDASARPTPLPTLDLRGLPGPLREQAAGRYARAEAARPFDLARGPLIRATLLRMGAHDHVALLTMHHIVSDGWSTPILLGELQALYAAMAAGRPNPLPDLPIQYADFAVWQRGRAPGEALERQLGYWKAQLADLPPLDLPTDHPRPPIESFRAGEAAFTLAPPQLDELLALGQAEEATPFMALLAGWLALLARYSGQGDFAVGTPIANRARKEIQPLIGCFVNTLALRAPLAGDPSFRAALRRVRQVCLAAYANQDIPFEQVVEALHPARDLGRNPIFQAMFTLDHAPAPAADAPGLALRPLPVVTEAIPFDLQLSLTQGQDGLAGALEYGADLFDAPTILRMVGHFRALLAEAVAAPDRPLGDLPLLAPAERQQILREWNDTGIRDQGAGIRGQNTCVHDLVAAEVSSRQSAVSSQDACVHDLVAAQAARAPDAVALAFQPAAGANSALGARHASLAAHLSYGALIGRAHQLAHHLRARGCGPETRVALALPRTPELVIALLGIFAAGCAAVPLDPDAPAQRRAFLLDDSGAAILVTKDQRRTTNDKSESSFGLGPSSFVDLGVDWPAIAAYPAHPPAPAPHPDNLAYLIYTSGSAGAPKAVLVSHRSLAAVLRASRARFALGPRDCGLWLAAATFDIALFELFAPLLAGGSVALADPRALLAAARLPAALERLTLLHAVPSLLRQLLQLPRVASALPRLRLICVGGERVPPELLAELARTFPQTARHILYGPTEATLFCAWTAAAPDPRHSLLGAPLPGRALYVLDARGRLVPPGAAGELYVGGIGLARGYHARPDLTAAAFLPNPFTKRSGVRGQGSDPDPRPLIPDPRLYRTGDRARWRMDGQLLFLGRIDAQVKLRGIRIEPGEVEAALAQHPSVREAAVLLREDAPGELRLVAYIVPGSGSGGQGSGRAAPDDLIPDPRSLIPDLRAFLAARLPAALIPSAFVALDALPLTAHGKLDRAALPAPDAPDASDAPARADAAPRTPEEQLLAALWGDLLPGASIGRQDDFFALGGHSLLATQLVARVRAALGVDLPLRALFEAPILADLARRIAGARRDGADPPPPPRPADRAGAPPLSFAQQRLWFIDQIQPGNPAYNIAIAVRMAGPLDTAALARSLGAVVRRHEALRTTFALVDGRPVQRIAPAQPVYAPLLDLRAFPAEAQTALAQRLARDEARRSFDLARGPLIRATLLRMGARDHVALLALHHIISDGWSMDVLLRELMETYAARAAGRVADLPALPIQYADYALWQRAWLRGSALDAQLAYWKTQLAGLPTLDLPADRPRPAVQSFRGATRDIALPDALSASLRALSRRAGCTLFMTLLAGWQALLARYSGQDDLAVGSPIAGRTHAELEPLIGCFINTLTLRADLSGGPSFRALLDRTRAACLDAYAHQDIPFEQIVDALQPERGLNRNPLFQTLFSLQAAPPLAPAPPGLALRPLAIEQGTTQFDLLLALEETPGGLAGTLDYATDLFDAPTIARLLRHFQALLAGAVADPDRRFDDLPLLAPAERQQVLVEWNDTEGVGGQGSGVRRSPSDAALLHELFATQASRTPDAVALVFDAPQMGEGLGAGYALPQTPSPYSDRPPAAQLTYGELNARANRLARHLRALGVGPEARVAVCMERSPDLVIALMGILKAGSAYLPLDPSHPPERLAFMLDDAQASVIVTQERMADDLPASWAYVVRIDADWEAIALHDAGDPPGGARPDNLAYTLYTSGSTGQPKGVLITHQGLANYLGWCAQRYLDPGGRGAPVHSPLGFDLTITSLFAPLLAGQAVALLPERAGPDALGAALRASAGWSLVKLTPAHLELLTRQIPPAAAGSARALVIGGEALHAEQLALWRTHAPTTRLINEYGPTETVVGCCVYEVPHMRPPSGAVPIGRPIAGVRLHLLDRRMRPAPIGVAGEIYVGGMQLARGYLGRPDLTAAAFVPNPFVQGSGVRGWGADPDPRLLTPDPRLYRTGDLGRYRPDGVIEFLGRADRQIKLRGYRVEPGEVEAALAAHPAVRAAAVLLREDAPGDARLVAYVVTSDELRVTSGPDATKDEGRRTKDERGDPSRVTRHSSLREFLAATLPDYMIPSAFVDLDALPLTPNGKLDRSALPAPDGARPDDAPFLPPHSDIERRIAAIWRDVLRVEAVGVHDNFFDLGGHSLLMVQVLSRLRADLLVDLSMVDLFQAPTVAALAALIEQTRPHIAAQQILRADLGERQAIRARQASPGSAQPIAIIAMSGRFPGAEDIAAFWRNLRDGVESIRFFSDQELIDAGADPAALRDPSYVKAHGAIDGIELFDAALFGYAPREAELIDPQQRMFLECAWEALESAGYDPQRYGGRIGVYAGSGLNSYLVNLLANPEAIEALDGLQIVLGNDKDFLATRVSYKLGLRGPSVTVQTACSTALVAAHLACRSLRDGECDIALAGGVSVGVPQATGYRYVEGGISSPDGHCRAFDARAQGAISGSGMGVVALKRLDDALTDGDPILAIIAGSAVNNDGSDKVGYTAPSVQGQAAAIAEAHALAGIDAASIRYVEAHGTGTPLGDPIEVAALTQAFRLHTDATGFCALGSVKTNIGHLDAAAGAAGLIKAVLALQHRQIPPSLHFERPNPQIDFANSPFYVNARLADWPAATTPRRAGVSSFGLGGTNAHLLLEEAPPRAPGGPSRPHQLLLLSANTPAALDALTNRLADHLRAQPAIDLADAAYTLQVGRRGLRFRRTLVCRDTSDAAHALAARDPRRLATHAHDDRTRQVVFMFPGQGSQHAGMGRELYEAEPTFRAEVDRCAEILRPILGRDIRELLYPADERRTTNDEGPLLDDGAPSSFVRGPSSETGADLNQTQYAQPALFVVEYALARLWMEWGVVPQALIGHSVGEYVAATIAGVFALDDALNLVAARGRIMQDLPEGAMLAVPLPEAEIRPLLGDLDLAAVNGPALCAVSGPVPAIERLERELSARGVAGRRLHVSHAFHSAMIDPAVAPFAELARRVRLRPPQIPFISNLSGGWISAAEATSPDYWARQLRSTVRFADGVQELLREPGRALLEVGPGQSLSALARQSHAPGEAPLIQPSMRRPTEPGSDVAHLLAALGRLWLAGCPIDWFGVYAHERRLRVALPTYPFERQRYWIAPARRAPDQPRRASALPRPRGLADWFYVPIWKQSTPLRPAPPGAASRWLLLIPEGELGALLARRLEQSGQQVVVARAGAAFARPGEREYAIDPRSGADYARLLDDLRERGALPDRIVHLWSAARPCADMPAHERFEPAQDLGCYSLLLLAQAIGRQRRLGPLHIAVVTDGMHEVADGALRRPEQATILGPCRVIPQEYPNITCQSIDIALPPDDSAVERIAGHLHAELLARRPDSLIAYRGNQRWAQVFEPLPLDAPDPEATGLRERGVYLITGGMGALGLHIAGYLARAARARLVLVGRSPFPARGEWDRWISRAGPDDATARRIRLLRAVEAAGSEALIVQANVADPAQVRAAVAQTLERYGALHGVVHAAGVAADHTTTPVQETDPTVCARHFAAKARGLFALEQALRGHDLDFCLLCSSLSTVLGGLGFAAYAAANAFQDAFAQAQSRPGAPPWISVDWDGWQIDDALDPPRPLGARGGAQGIAPADGVEAFARIVASAPGARVAVSTADLHDRIAQWVDRAAFAAPDQPAESAPQHPRPALPSDYVAPRDDVERQIAAIWQEILGIAPIGIYDDFFALGGHSLLAIQIMARLRDALAVDLPLRDLFEAATVADLAGQIARAAQQERHPPAAPVARVSREAYRVKRSALPGDDEDPLAR